MIMEEKILAESEKYNISKWLRIVFLSISGISLIILVRDFVSNLIEYISCRTGNGCDFYLHWGCCAHEDYSAIEYAIHYLACGWTILVIIGIGLICLLIHAWLHSYSITITDKRVYGKAAFGKSVDLPVDSISAVGTSFLKGIEIGTSSGSIKFKLIKNQAELCSTLSELLRKRQTAKEKNECVSANVTEELKKYKELLDGGVISQEEFDAKKKQLLGL